MNNCIGIPSLCGCADFLQHDDRPEKNSPGSFARSCFVVFALLLLFCSRNLLSVYIKLVSV